MFEELSKSELSIGRILTMSGSIFKECMVSFFMLTVVINLPINILTYYTFKDLEQLNSIFLIIEMGIFFMLLLPNMGVAYIVENKVKNNKLINFTEGFNVAFKNWGKAIGVYAILLLIITGLMFLLVIPALIAAVYFSFAFLVVVLRNKSGLQALMYSKNLVSGKWFKVFAYNFVFVSLGMLFSLGVSMIFVNIQFNFVVQILLDTFLSFISTYLLTCIVLLFLNLDYTKTEQIEN